MSKESSVDLWLIKSGGRLIGPLDTNKVKNMLVTKEILPIDEISLPFGRWRYIRDLPLFESTLNEVKNRKETEKTFTSTMSLSGLTETEITEKLNKTPVEDILKVSEITPTPIDKGSIAPVRPSNSHLLERAQPAVYPIERKAETQTASWIWFASVFVVIGILVTFLFQDEMTNETGNLKSFAPLVQEASTKLEMGEYREAQKSYQEAYKLKSNDPTVVLNLAPLMIWDHQTVSAKNMIHKLLLVETDPENIAEAKNLYGLAALKDRDLLEASSFFDQSLKTNGQYSAAIFNRGMVSFYQKNWSEAEFYFLKARSLSSEEGIVSLALGETSSEQYRSTKNPEIINRAIQLLTDYESKNYDYRQEAKILKSYLYSELGELDKSVTEIELAMDFSPDTTEQHLHNLKFYRQNGTWDQVVQWVRKVHSKTEPTPRREAMMGLAEFKSGLMQNGTKRIEDARNKAPEDPLVQALAAYVRMDVDPKGAGVILNSISSHNFFLPILLKATWCEKQNNLDCAMKFWTKALEIDSRSIEAIAGLSRVYKSKGEFGRARAMVKEGRLLSNRYIPYVKLLSN